MVAGKLTVVGLGYGDEHGLPLGNWRRLRTARHLFLRTAHHPVVDFLRREGIAFVSFDEVYDRAPRYEEVYPEITERLLAALQAAIQSGTGAEAEVVYAVPGHPMVAEKTVQLLLERAQQDGFQLEVLPAPSFLDALSARLHLDPIEGLLILDGTSLTRSQLNPELVTVIPQVYDRAVASDVKLTLMEVYPDDYPVYVANALGVPGLERLEQLPLYELDREAERFGHLSLLVLPAVEGEWLNRRYERLLEIVATLRGPQGCPWDRAQTHQSLRRYLIEEAAELLDAIDAEDPEQMEEELGDLLLQILLHAQIASETGYFHMDDVIEGLSDKLIRRHPHVFGESSASTAEEVAVNWQRLKQQERKEKGLKEPESLLGSLPKTLSALLAADILQRRAAEVGFDWTDPADCLAKVKEELQEVERAAAENRAEELGDLLFAVVNLCRFYRVDPEAALSRANKKFRFRFQHIERRLREQGRTFADTGLEEMDTWWEEAKRLEREGRGKREGSEEDGK
ncbi:MAG: nucleoside triphosphate pyrophosphohydrolase [Bacillus thermozeamaize]|jgi:tetrapyrrole methylase family protein/MazG family protein|uniref:Nucleoside triphosphate pyrophosphohydrolase n=1 Tax=Bacillus thermozeamaize TaxID=230954 RepID=A0A1Y3PLX2_9BACI|nr:MAG: nucleoside triphosphate pyrophosphohydrolase [Bacillus thermozeamaize]